MKIFLDPGHTGQSDPGAVGQGGTTEAEINMAVALILRDILTKRGHEVALSREGPDDSVDELHVRVDMAEAFEADCLVSIHCNAFTDYRAHGFEIWTLRGQDESDVLADHIALAVQAHLPFLAIRADYTDGDVDKEAGFSVLKADMPAVLVELAFISNPVEEGILADPFQQQKFAEAISEGIANWWGA